MRKKTLVCSSVILSSALALGSAAWAQTSSEMGSGNQRSQSGSMGHSSMGGQWSHQDVRSVQEALREKGYNPGASDGIMGPRTQAALRQFQRAQNLQATGQLDGNTASALGVSLSSSSGAMGGSERSGASMGSSARGQRDAGRASNQSREGTGPGSPEGRSKDGTLPGTSSSGGSSGATSGSNTGSSSR